MLRPLDFAETFTVIFSESFTYKKLGFIVCTNLVSSHERTQAVYNVRVISKWNSLPLHIRESKSLSTFKQNVKSYLLTKQ